MPELALLLCTIFVLFLLRLERKQSPEVSHALWVPTVWMLVIASKPLAIWFGTVGGTESESPLDQIFLSGLLCFGLYVLFRRRFNWSGAVKENSWLMLLIGYMLVSILWSDIPLISFKRWIRELIAVVMAFLVASEPSPRQAVQTVIRRTVYILVPFSPVLIKYFPQYGRQYAPWSGKEMWTGVTMQKNDLGRLCLIGAFFLIWTLVRRWKRRDVPVGKYQTRVDVFLLIVTFWLLKGPPGAYSATAIAALAVGLAIFAGLLWMEKGGMHLGANTLTIMMALVMVYGVAALMLGGLGSGELSATLGRDATLTGRTEAWGRLLSSAMRQPILGGGFGSMWTPRTRAVYNISEGHSGYLDVLLELGFVGLCLVSMYLLSCLRRAHRELSHDFCWGILWICYLMMAALHNITETSFNSLASQLTAVLLFLAVSSSEPNSYGYEVNGEVTIAEQPFPDSDRPKITM